MFLGLVFMLSIRLPGMSDLALGDEQRRPARRRDRLSRGLRSRRPSHDRPSAYGLVVALGRHRVLGRGQVVWSYYEVVLDQQVPFPSLADVGFVLFPLVAAVAW